MTISLDFGRAERRFTLIRARAIVMTKRLFEIECMGQPVTVEVTDNGPVLHGYDPDVEEAARTLED